MSIEWFEGLDGVTLTLEIGLAGTGTGFMLFDVGQFDVGRFGPDVVWNDRSTDLRSVSTSRVFSREVAAWDPGTAQVVLNNRHRYYSASNLSASNPFVSGGISQIIPLRPLRLRATYAGVTYDLYTGKIQDWLETFVGAYADAVVSLPCEDAMSSLSAIDGAEQTPVGQGELSGTRIHRILDNAKYPGPRNVEPGQVTMQSTNLSANVATELKLVADSEGGGLFIDADGAVVFEQQYALIENTRSNTIQATFGDGSGSELPCTDVIPSNGGDLIKNSASFARSGSDAQLVEDPGSIGRYDLRRESRTDLVCEFDAHALALAEWHVARFKDPEYRIKQIKVCPRDDPARLYPVVFRLRPRDLVRVVARPTPTETITRDCHIAGIHHEVTGDNWITTFDLWSATPYTSNANSRFDVGRFDTMTLFYGTGG